MGIQETQNLVDFPCNATLGDRLRGSEGIATYCGPVRIGEHPLWRRNTSKGLERNAVRMVRLTGRLLPLWERGTRVHNDHKGSSDSRLWRIDGSCFRWGGVYEYPLCVSRAKAKKRPRNAYGATDKSPDREANRKATGEARRTDLRCAPRYPLPKLSRQTLSCRHAETLFFVSARVRKSNNTNRSGPCFPSHWQSFRGSPSSAPE